MEGKYKITDKKMRNRSPVTPDRFCPHLYPEMSSVYNGSEYILQTFPALRYP
jgi:hypothetical protein